MTWRERAACRDEDPELWFPTPGAIEQAQAAIAVCATCPVAAECLSEGQARKAQGIWGGHDLTIGIASGQRGRPKAAACRRGHPWTPESTIVASRGSGWQRECRVCRDERAQARRRREREGA